MDDFIPFAAPSTAAFGENSPKGRCMDAARCQRDRKSLLATLVESEERKEKAATGGLFFGYFLFDCMDAGGRAMQEQLPRPRKRK